VASGVLFVLLNGIGVPGGDFRIVPIAIVIGWAWASLTAARVASGPSPNGACSSSLWARSQMRLAWDLVSAKDLGAVRDMSVGTLRDGPFQALTQ